MYSYERTGGVISYAELPTKLSTHQYNTTILTLNSYR